MQNFFENILEVLYGKIKTQSKTDAESIRELEEINNKFIEIDDRLNVLLGNTLVN